MAAGTDRPERLLGRRAECATLDHLVSEVAAGGSRVLVLRGEPGIGKSALLDFMSGLLAGWCVTRAVGVESEMALAYNGLHQVCVPLLGHLTALPQPQRGALETVFGLSAGPPPDRFLIGLATLTLMAEAAEHGPVACLVDDAQWLDHETAQILNFVGRRLLAERVALVCGARTGAGDEVLAGLPELVVRGLGDAEARTLLLAHVHGRLDPAIVEQFVADSHGNPLALLELPRLHTPAEIAGGFGLPGTRPLVSKIEESFTRRLLLLPPRSRLLVLVAAAEPLGDPALLWTAAAVLGIDAAALTPATDAGLLRMRRRVEFAHPLVRSAAYRAASLDDRRRVHRALAVATDAEADPDRHAWHRARAAPGPDEDVAAELEQSAGRAQARGGLAAAAAFLRRSVELTPEPARRAQRALAASQACLQVGAFEAARALVGTAESGPIDEFQSAMAGLVRGHTAFASGFGSDAPPLLLRAARQIESFDRELARETYLIAWGAAGLAGAAGGDVLLEISRAAQALPPRAGPPSALALLLEGLARTSIGGPAAGAPVSQRAVAALADIPLPDVLRWGWMATSASALVWDVEAMHAISARMVGLVRDAGALALLSIYLAQLGITTTWMGDLPGAAAIIAESEGVAAATGSHMAPYTLLRLRSLQGREAEANAAIARAIAQAGTQGQGMASAWGNWAAAVLYNGLGRYGKALPAGQRATVDSYNPWMAMWALPELVEAAARAGDTDQAREALERLTATTRPCGNDLALGIEARSRALLSDGYTAADLHREAIDRLGRTPLRPELARAHLVHGEWLRGEGRRLDAREQLRTAYDMFVAIGMEAFAGRARRELVRVGDKVPQRTAEAHDELTPQEEQIARLARAGLSNPEIGAQLFLSARTAEWHLRKVFAKLGITSRRQLHRALPDRD
ncbi:AAA family ATPase [Actinoplanes solisilvae]|uniref:AAA family ATPase n=1 Tax=Actinoplanes solisilvae TaxID=2486853 RepID=UPI000FDA2F3C|nr:LuxR family transcriptional regulator [Actinoplanes solisilvae]